MKLIRLEAEGLFLFEDKVVIDFVAEQKVYPNNSNMLTHLFSNNYTNNVLSFVGINASGKTTTLKLISFVMSMLNAEAINTISTNNILDKSNNVILKSYFHDNGYVYLLETQIESYGDDGVNDRYVITKEKLYVRSEKSIISKSNLFVFNEDNIYLVREDESSGKYQFLKDDVSIVISIGKTGNVYFRDFTFWTDFNILNSVGNFPVELIQFLDPSIEYIKYNHNNSEIIIKFVNDKDSISVRGVQNISNYLSSGTIKGLSVFMNAWMVLLRGGYFIIDEIENHFNKEIVATLIRFFMDEKVNVNGASLLYSTHYVELLDEIDRNDSIYVIRNTKGIRINKFLHLLKRNDIKKSDILQSGLIDGTAPSYEAFIKLRRVFSTGAVSEKNDG